MVQFLGSIIGITIAANQTISNHSSPTNGWVRRVVTKYPLPRIDRNWTVVERKQWTSRDEYGVVHKHTLIVRESPLLYGDKPCTRKADLVGDSTVSNTEGCVYLKMISKEDPDFNPYWNVTSELVSYSKEYFSYPSGSLKYYAPYKDTMWWTREGSYESVRNVQYNMGCQGNCYNCTEEDTYSLHDGPWDVGWNGNESWHYTYYYSDSWPGPHRSEGSSTVFGSSIASEIWANQLQAGILHNKVSWK